MRVSIQELVMLGVPPEAGAEFVSEKLEMRPGRFRVHEVVGRWAEVKVLAWCTPAELTAARATTHAA